jgi:hypothetical protein
VPSRGCECEESRSDDNARARGGRSDLISVRANRIDCGRPSAPRASSATFVSGLGAIGKEVDPLRLASAGAIQFDCSSATGIKRGQVFETAQVIQCSRL